ncbi:MAG: type VI secretion system tip protein TssI/VgrG [Planctomycetota bacterium]|nr:type VI secretion system tip protein TssI/VgrG [Planctomycetota bacterium]
MISNATQIHRQLSIATPLGDHELLLESFAGREALSELFEYELELLSGNDEINPKQIIGENVTFSVRQPGSPERHFNGYVKRFRYVGEAGHDETECCYRATVVPWLWFLTQKTDCRMFQNMSVPDIIEQVFTRLNFRDFDRSGLNGSYRKREYCVQYNETDFAFVSRLMEEEGIFFFFKHENGRHILHLADHALAYYPLVDCDVEFVQPTRSGGNSDRCLDSWEHVYEFRPGRFAHKDFNFKTPDHGLLNGEDSAVSLVNNRAFEIYEFPGRFEDVDGGEAYGRLRIEEQEQDYDVVEGSGTYRSFSPGGTFRLQRHRIRAEESKSFVLKSVEIEASQRDNYKSGPSRDGDITFRTKFHCLPDYVAFRSPRITRKPIVEGPQTAVIVGPPGAEIFPDEFGRVKCQFHWDREGQFNEDSSCWIRVSQQHAGKGWGGIDLPRIDEEVIVDFLEGDPDRPIITGRVYNGENQPPFSLPAGMTRSGMKSQTHKGAGFNEISMDDTAGKEQIRINGQYNMDTAVGNNQTLVVGVDRSAEIGNNDATTVGNDSVEQIGNNKKVSVGNNMNVDVGSKLVMNAGSSITLKCGASKLHMNAGGVITLTGTIITVAAAANASVVAPMTQIVGGAMLTTIGGINMMQGGVTHVAGAALCSVAGAKVDVVGGQTQIKGAPIKLN